MSERLFGTDGIRGMANMHPMTAELALRVGRAAGHIFKNGERLHTILIGKDTRRSCYMIENALTAGLCSMGIRVLLTGPLPTPGVSYIARSLRCDGAIMISASHNPYEDNGIKIFGADGYKIPDAMEDEIQRLVMTDEIDKIRPVGGNVGTARRIDDAVGRYIEFVKFSFPKGMRLDGIRMVVDCANGASYRVGPNTFSELGAEVIAIGNQPDGMNINKRLGSVYPEEMRATVIREKADVGISFDGDGDRLAMADENGRLIDGNAVLAIIGVDMLERDMLPGKALVTTIMANGGLEKALEPYKGKVVRSDVGDRNVVETMRRERLTVGGEPSGHIVMLEYNPTGDAMVAALQTLAIMIRREQPLSVIAQVYREMPECHLQVPCNVERRPDVEALACIAREVEPGMQGKGRIVVRLSGTEPVVRVMVQHHEVREARYWAELVADKVAALVA